ncbi:hypothetical protein SAMN05443144_105215 [Fodinibius roseus]|uniref:Uncharacterized protein n=1 Tax=Fodinibius roseus TaxID=1194090 RepID=A0A1M4Z0R4_9BACT|nr:hypothetical protein [Fodinibius roseus]SHF11673.1 hypothetical protein SAMN05443144_105215 [Fodinibius roseus]
MSNQKAHTAKTILSQVVLLGCLFCVLFGQGTHFHEIILHLDDHLDIHAHVHAHESNDQPFQADSERDTHQHEVNKATDIIGTLTTSIQVTPDVKTHAILSFDEGHELSNRVIDETPSIFDLPPPRSVGNQYYLSSFSLRGPPLA